MECPDALEKEVLAKLFDGDHPTLRVLHQQAECAMVVSRKVTAAGFFTLFEVPEGIRLAGVASAKIRFGDVNAVVAGLQHGAGFLVYVDDGKLKMLEGYTYDETWPGRVETFELHYADPDRQSVEQTFGLVR